MIDRQSGFYWVRYSGDHWEVARWVDTNEGFPQGWYLTASELTFDDDDFIEIGRRVDV